MIFYTEPRGSFSETYIAVRKKEGRIFDKESLALLPEVTKAHPHFSEWKLRKKSALRFREYLSKKPMPLSVLEIGCGNGWFSNFISGEGRSVLGIDINNQELEQADAVFKKSGLAFAYADIFKKSAIWDMRFDIIVLNSCLQYFSDVARLVDTIRPLLTDDGAIHIIDTPFYDSSEIESAKKRSAEYYEALGFPEMALQYFHHSRNDLGKYVRLYRPSGLKYFTNDSPFYWVKLNRDEIA